MFRRKNIGSKSRAPFSLRRRAARGAVISIVLLTPLISTLPACGDDQPRPPATYSAPQERELTYQDQLEIRRSELLGKELTKQYREFDKDPNLATQKDRVKEFVDTSYSRTKFDRIRFLWEIRVALKNYFELHGEAPSRRDFKALCTHLAYIQFKKEKTPEQMAKIADLNRKFRLSDLSKMSLILQNYPEVQPEILGIRGRSNDKTVMAVLKGLNEVKGLAAIGTYNEFLLYKEPLAKLLTTLATAMDKYVEVKKRYPEEEQVVELALFLAKGGTKTASQISFGGVYTPDELKAMQDEVTQVKKKVAQERDITENPRVKRDRPGEAKGFLDKTWDWTKSFFKNHWLKLAIIAAIAAAFALIRRAGINPRLPFFGPMWSPVTTGEAMRIRSRNVQRALQDPAYRVNCAAAVSGFDSTEQRIQQATLYYVMQRGIYSESQLASDVAGDLGVTEGSVRSQISDFISDGTLEMDTFGNVHLPNFDVLELARPIIDYLDGVGGSLDYNDFVDQVSTQLRVTQNLVSDILYDAEMSGLISIQGNTVIHSNNIPNPSP